MTRAAACLAMLGALALTALAPNLRPEAAAAQEITPPFSIWDVVLGGPVGQIPPSAVAEIACGTDGGPPSLPLDSFDDFALCPAEADGLHEVYFTYDDEQDYIARALEVEFKVFRSGTSVFAHPAVVSVMVDGAGVVQGIRVVTDDRASLHERRSAVTVARNLKARFAHFALDCRDIPPREGEQPVGNQFTHELCRGTDPGDTLFARIEASYLRKKGQEGLNRETQKVNSGYFESRARLDLRRAAFALPGED